MPVVEALKSWISRFATYLGEIYIVILCCNVAVVAAAVKAAKATALKGALKATATAAAKLVSVSAQLLLLLLPY